MGIFGNIFKKQNEIKIDSYTKTTSTEEELFPDEEVELIDGQIMNISKDGIIDTNSKRATEIYKHNLKLLLDDT